MNEPINRFTQRQLPPQFVDSTFQDDVWYVPAARSRKSMCWNRVRLGNGKLLVAPEYSQLLFACKIFIVLVAETQSGRMRRPVKGASLVALFGSLRVFLRWMTNCGIYDFAALTIDHVIGYRKFVEMETTVVTHKHGILPPGSRKSLSPNAQFGRIYAILCLARLGTLMGSSGCRLSVREVNDVCASISSNARTEKSTVLIPDDLFRRIISSALELLREPGVAVVVDTMARFQDDWARYARAKGIPDKAFDPRRRMHYNRWRQQITGPTPFSLHGDRYSVATLRWVDLIKLIDMIRAACLIIVAGLVGMRLSELRTLERNCLRTRVLDDGKVLVSVRGRLFKTVDDCDGEDADWVAGWDGPDQPVRLAISTLDQLAQAQHSEVLFPRARSPKGNTIDRSLSGRKLLKLIRAFSQYVKVGHNWPFALHQFRKTFARFVVLSSINAPLALMRHFKHVSIQMTERYFPNDPDLISEIVEASESIIAERLETVFGAERLGGLKGRDIIARNEAYRSSEHAKELKDLVQMTMRDPTVRILLHIYGICLYDEATAKCKGDFTNIGMWTCADCPNAAMDASVTPFWEEELRRLDDAIAFREQCGIIDLDLIKQRDRALSILNDVEHGRQTA